MEYVQMALACLTAIFIAFTTKKWKDLKWLGRTMVLIAAILSIVVFINGCNAYRKKLLVESIEKSFGDIEYTPGTYKPALKFGRGGANFMGLTTISFTKEIVLRVYAQDDKLLLSTVIRDRDGNVIAVIDENEWTMFQKDKYEYNNDAKGFEIVTKGDRKVWFQISLNDSIATLNGFLINKFGKGAYFTSDRNSQAMFIYLVKGFVFTPSDIPTLFKYPRERYYGVRRPSN